MKCGLRVPERVRDCHLSVTARGTHAKVTVMAESASSLFSLAEGISIFFPSSHFVSHSFGFVYFVGERLRTIFLFFFWATKYFVRGVHFVVDISQNLSNLKIH